MLVRLESKSHQAAVSARASSMLAMVTTPLAPPTAATSSRVSVSRGQIKEPMRLLVADAERDALIDDEGLGQPLRHANSSGFIMMSKFH